MLAESEIINLVRDADSWSERYLDVNKLETSLRSSLLKPKSELWDYVTPDKYIKKSVSKLCEQRSNIINSEKINLVENPTGRILCFRNFLSLKDAAVCRPSFGFIDEEDSPPWDTWLFFLEEDIEQNREYSSLYSWVPNSLVYLIDSAIEEDWYDCLIWAETLEKQLGLQI